MCVRCVSVEGIIYDFSLCHVCERIGSAKKVHGMLVNWFVWRFKVQSRFVILNGLFSWNVCWCIKMHVFVISFLARCLIFFSGDKNLIFMHVFAITFSLSLYMHSIMLWVLQSSLFLFREVSWEKIIQYEKGNVYEVQILKCDFMGLRSFWEKNQKFLKYLQGSILKKIKN